MRMNSQLTPSLRYCFGLEGQFAQLIDALTCLGPSGVGRLDSSAPDLFAGGQSSSLVVPV